MHSPDQIRRNPDYVLEWPVEIVLRELTRLIERGESTIDHKWDDDVRLFLEKAFTGTTALKDFDIALTSYHYPSEQEPF